MNWDEAFKMVFSALGAVGGAGVVIIALSTWLSKVWANRILETDRNRYASEIEALRLSNQNFINALSLTNSAYLESKKAFTEKRIDAVQTIWAQIIKLRDERPSSIIFLDILTLEEYPELSKNSKFSYAKNATNPEAINSIIHSEADLVRPFLDDRSYQLYWGYRSLTGRLCVYINNFYSKEPPIHDWRDDHGVIQILQSTLTQQEMDLFKNNKWATTELFNYLEMLISNHLKKLSSGVDLANETLEHSLSFNRAASEIVKSELQAKIN